jgi:hypothetical protein
LPEHALFNTVGQDLEKDQWQIGRQAEVDLTDGFVAIFRHETLMPERLDHGFAR